MRDLFDKPESWEANPGIQPAMRAAPFIIVAVIACVLAAVVVAYVLATQSGTDEGSLRPDVAAEAVIGSNAVLLGDYPDGAQWLSFYRRNQDLLGEPVLGEQSFRSNAACVFFVNYVACRSQDPGAQGTSDEYVLQPLGSDSFPSGVDRVPNAEVDGRLRLFIDQVLTARGRDWYAWLGQPVSEPFCASDGIICFQVFERQLVRFPNHENVGWRDVQLAPLGLIASEKEQ